MDFGKIQLAKCASLSTQNEAVFVSFKACEAVGVVGPPGRSRVTPARTAFVPSFTSTPRRFISCNFYPSRLLSRKAAGWAVLTTTQTAVQARSGLPACRRPAIEEPDSLGGYH